MKRNTKFETLAVGALVAMALGVNGVEARPAELDAVYKVEFLETHRLATVAILPAVSICDDQVAERRAERGWPDLYRQAKTRWMSAEDVRRRLAAASGGSGDLQAKVDAQVWRHGAVDSETAARLARLLGVDAVLSIRIDRWEIVDGGRGTVGLTAVLLGSDGVRLWSACGLAGHGRGRLSNEGTFSCDRTVYWDPRLEPDDRDHRTSMAFHALLARWATALPVPVYESELPSGLLAHLEAE